MDRIDTSEPDPVGSAPPGEPRPSGGAPVSGPAPPPPVPTWQPPGFTTRRPGPASPLRTPSQRRDPWGTESFADQDDVAVGSRRRRSAHPLHRSLLEGVDTRGIFVGGVSVLLLPACFVTYYTLQGTTGSGRRVHATFTVVAQVFGSWRIVIPLVSVVCAAVGIMDGFTPVAARGAVTIFVILRVAVVGQLALWIVAIVDRTPTTPMGAPQAGVTWVAWASIGVAAVAVLGSLASMARNKYS